jgi:hypothetical protein
MSDTEKFDDWSAYLQKIVHLEKAAFQDLLEKRYNSAYEHLLHIESQTRQARAWILKQQH